MIKLFVTEMISPSLFRVPLFKIHLRDVHQTQFLSKSSIPMHMKIEKELGLRQPQRPLAPFFRYMKEVRPSVVKSNPTEKALGLAAIIGKMWKSLDEKQKQKYTKAYGDDKLKYQTEITKYRETLSEDDKTKIRELKAEISDRKMRLEQLSELRDLGRPKRPPNAFLNFAAEHKFGNGKLPREQYLDHLRRIGSLWKALTDDERAKYKSTENLAKYKKALSEWESKMIKQGRRDVVRVEVIVPDESMTAKLPKRRRKCRTS